MEAKLVIQAGDVASAGVCGLLIVINGFLFAAE
jgi:hypothetical protein